MSSAQLSGLEKFNLVQHWYVNSTPLTPAAHAVLARLLHHLNPTSLRCDPSINRIAKDIGRSAKTVSKAVGELEKAGVIRVSDRQRGRRNRYHIVKPQTIMRNRIDMKPKNFTGQSRELDVSQPEKFYSPEKKKENKKKRGSNESLATFVPKHGTKVEPSTLSLGRRKLKAENDFHNAINEMVRSSGFEEQAAQKLDIELINEEFEKVWRKETTSAEALERIGNALHGGIG